MRNKFRFDRDFDFQVKPGVEIAYKAGTEQVIPQAHAEAAIAAGVGDYVEQGTEANEAPTPEKAKH